MHVDGDANHLCLAFCMEEPGISGGKFVLPARGVFFKLEDNLLFFFANEEPHGTAVMDLPEGHEGRLTMAHSIPRRLWSFVTTRGFGPAPGLRCSEPGGDEDVLRHSEPLADDEGKASGEGRIGITVKVFGDGVSGIDGVFLVFPGGFGPVVAKPKDEVLFFSAPNTLPNYRFYLVLVVLGAWPADLPSFARFLVLLQERDVEDRMDLGEGWRKCQRIVVLFVFVGDKKRANIGRCVFSG
ncbi:MAG: hypothetical protein BJ554DRAFT_499 [Olpidium bornovanus]|uniref:Uncharacterized protein n=1 Tax=Olpidium bornovanus TaxID=278681 RepID=A0A8H7ZTZ6_9FUNG|nr:MAG: hypothetical protein BJ554DRAFT_499 [Olpidium bornovanus]